VLLLGKVKENKALTRAELVELKRYERKAAAGIIAKAKMPAKPRAEKKKPKGAPPPGPGRKKAKKTKKKRKARPPVDVAEIRRLGIDCEKLADADAAITTRMSMVDLFKKYPELKDAWERGRFLRNLRILARTRATISEAAERLGFASGRALRAVLDEDMEVADLWKQTNLAVSLELRMAVMDAAREGKADAIRAVESMLPSEKEQAGADLTRITINQLVGITGRTRRTIHDWYSKLGMPRNVDKTFDLSIFFAWFEDFLRDKSGKEEIPDTYRAMKVEKLKAELARHRNETLDRKAVIIQLVAWAQHIVSYCNRHNEELSRLCIGQPREKVLEIHRHFFRELHAATARVPKEFHLSDDKGKELVAFLLSLKPENGGPGHEL
jgi:AraC-like DNA-binding protein